MEDHQKGKVMVDKNIIRAMVESERMMDKGEIPFVFAPSPNGGYERFAVNAEIMTELELEQGQSINTMIMDAIIELQLALLTKKIEERAQMVEDLFLDPDYDFRKDMTDDNNN